jgi:hypothetical protein
MIIFAKAVSKCHHQPSLTIPIDTKQLPQFDQRESRERLIPSGEGLIIHCGVGWQSGEALVECVESNILAHIQPKKRVGKGGRRAGIQVGDDAVSTCHRPLVIEHLSVATKIVADVWHYVLIQLVDFDEHMFSTGYL